jgi:hypothetical protein
MELLLLAKNLSCLERLILPEKFHEHEGNAIQCHIGVTNCHKLSHFF